MDTVRSFSGKSEVVCSYVNVFFYWRLLSLSFFMIFGPFGVHMMKNSQIKVKDKRDINQHQSDILISLNF